MKLPVAFDGFHNDQNFGLESKFSTYVTDSAKKTEPNYCKDYHCIFSRDRNKSPMYLSNHRIDQRTSIFACRPLQNIMRVSKLIISSLFVVRAA